MDSSMELVPPAPQPPPQQLLSPCQSPEPTVGSSEKFALGDVQAHNMEAHNDTILTSDDHDDPTLLLHVQDMLRNEASLEPSSEPSLFVEDSQDVMGDAPIAENNIDEAKFCDKEDTRAMDDIHIVEDGYAMEGDLTMEDEKQQTLQAPEPEANIEEDILPSVDNIAAQVSNNRRSQESEDFEHDDIGVTEEDAGSEFEYESSTSSSNECEHEAPGRNQDSSKAKKSNKPRRKVAHNPREYVARLHEEEDHMKARKMKGEEGKQPSAKRSHKRKLAGSDMGSSKVLKTASGNGFVISNSCTSTPVDHPLPPAQAIEAKTHADQMAQIIAGIPENCDNRRGSTQKKDLMEAKSLFGFKKVEADNGNWRLKGMKTSMRCHQLTAAAWMVKRELARTEPFGGILADAMGMGKTIMSLACIIGNQADDAHLAKYCKATLVVVPSKAIALQWEAEVRRHCNEPYNRMAFMYDRQREELDQLCKESLIVITTYKEIISQYPENIVLQTLAEKYGTDNISYHRELDKIMGHLFRINWYRIILDEAHAIKNPDSRTSKACCALLGKYRWALSGTPLSNSSEEMYPYMKFTQCNWTATRRECLKTFYFGKVPNAEFEALTSLIMYRRTMDDDFLGSQIISLPARVETNLWIPISAEEQCVVSAVSEHYAEMKARWELNTLGLGDFKDIDDVEEVDGAEEQQGNKNCRRKSTIKARSLRQADFILRRASQVRQRQSTSHVFCIEPLLRQAFSIEELAGLRCNLAQISNKETVLDQMQIGMEAEDEIIKYRHGLNILKEREEPFFGKYFDMAPFLDILGEECSAKDVTCLLCNTAKPPVDPIFSDTCGHVFCEKCILKAVKREVRGNDGKVDCPHPSCTKQLAVGEDITTIQKIMEEAEDRDSGYREPAKDCWNVSVQHGDDRNGFFTASTFRNDVPVLPSTKLTAAMAVVLTWMHEAPDDKILVFSQFKGTAKMMGHMLQTLDIGFVYYYGGLALSQKTRALDTIKTRDDIKVMVATLKSGGQSLNLTAANRVIIIDPWWNKTAEQQAFGRVVRIGQEKITHLVNIKTKEPIDHRIYTLQEKKAKDVDRTLQDDGHTPRTISEVELQKAFQRRKQEKEKRMAAKAKKDAAKNTKKKNT